MFKLIFRIGSYWCFINFKIFTGYRVGSDQILIIQTNHNNTFERDVNYEVAIKFGSIA